MRLSVVVPSWNGGELLARNLPEVVAQARMLPGGAEVLIVDDGSDPSDGTPGVVARVGHPASLVRIPGHRGFVAACNAGAAAAKSGFLLFLNNDVRPEAGCLTALVQAVEGHAEVFAAVPELLNVEDGKVESTVRLCFNHGVFDLVSIGAANAPPAVTVLRDVAYPCGGAFACRRSVFLGLGGFAARYTPFYWEDVDLGWRARRAGLSVVEMGSARARHEHSRTIGARFARRAIRTAFERNRLVFTWTHLTGARPWLVHLAWLPLRWLGALLRADAPSALPKALLAAPGIVAARRELRASGERARSLTRAVIASGRAGFPSEGNNTTAARVSR